MKARDGIEAQHGLNDIYPGDEYPEMSPAPWIADWPTERRDAFNRSQGTKIVKDDKSPYVRIAELEEECRQLRIALLNAVRPPMQFPAEWGVTRNEGRILMALCGANGRVVSRDHLNYAIHAQNLSEKNLDVYIYRLRGRLKRVGAKIICKPCFGWALDSAGLKTIREAAR